MLYLPTGVHLLMPTCDPLQRCSTNVPSGPQCHRGSGTRTPEPNRTENDSTTEPPRVLYTTTVTPGPSHHSMLDKQSQCSMTPRPFGYPPPSSNKQPMDPTWLKSSEEDVTDDPVTTSVSDTQMP